MRLALILFAAVALSCQPKQPNDIVLNEEASEADLTSFGNKTLSSYGFFQGELRNLQPVEGVFPYTINSPLFSDYAFKKRFVRIPDGGQIRYVKNEVFEFPEGSVLIKNFYYPRDFKQPQKNLRIMETRLLMLRKGVWEALTYVWNDEQTEANLEVAGKSMPVSWQNEHGSTITIDYSVPSINQCRGCHLKGEKVMPIGPSARQLNLGASVNQLTAWRDMGVLTGLPDLVYVPQLTAYENEREPVSDRARAWLEVNCAHCHRPDGQAKTSGLNLSADVTSAHELGIGKAPVAAGKGSGGRMFSVVRGRPDESILLYRIESTDPGVMMPEMGRKLVHQEGVDLVRLWILSLGSAQ